MEQRSDSNHPSPLPRWLVVRHPAAGATDPCVPVLFVVRPAAQPRGLVRGQGGGHGRAEHRQHHGALLRHARKSSRPPCLFSPQIAGTVPAGFRDPYVPWVRPPPAVSPTITPTPQPWRPALSWLRDLTRGRGGGK